MSSSPAPHASPSSPNAHATAPSVHVIGRGIIGLAAGFALMRGGWQVTMVGPTAAPGTASIAAVGLSSIKGKIRADAPLFAAKMLGHQGLREWLKTIEAASGQKIPQNFGGLLEPFFDVKEYARIRERVWNRQFSGCFGSEILPPSRLPFPAAGAWHYPGDGWFDPRACLAALTAALRLGGAQFCEQAVEKLRANPAGGVTLVTAEGVLQASQVVLAAGVFSNQILLRSDESAAPQAKSPLQQALVEGETVIRSVGPAWGNVLVRCGKVNYVVHAGHQLAGSTARVQPSLTQCAPSLAAAAQLLPVPAELAGLKWPPLHPAAALAPDIAAAYTGAKGFDGIIWGVRGRFRDRLPVIGSMKLPGTDRQVWLLSGFYKNGLQLAHLFAQELSNRLGGAPALPSFLPFAIERFRL